VIRVVSQHHEVDESAAALIYAECGDAMMAGRVSHVAPLELATTDHSRWRAGTALITWTPLKTRGYVLEETYEGPVVVTVLKGNPAARARITSTARTMPTAA